MERYLLQLRSDIREAVALAPVFDNALTTRIGEEEQFIEPTTSSIHLPELLGIPAEALPPSSFLDTSQMEMLVYELSNLWKAWQLYWDMPPNLSFEQQYSAMRRAMLEGEPIKWQQNTGGHVIICHYEPNGFCPYGQGGECYCKAVNEAAKHDLEVWEEHVRSQGIDPYIDLSEEIGAAFEAENKKRGLKKTHDDEWPQLDFFDFQQDFERDSGSSPDAVWDELEYWSNSITWETAAENDHQDEMETNDEISDDFDDFFDEDGFHQSL